MRWQRQASDIAGNLTTITHVCYVTKLTTPTPFNKWEGFQFSLPKNTMPNAL